MKNHQTAFSRAALAAALVVLVLDLSMACASGRRPGRGGPPADWPVSDFPQFVCVSSDDNGFSGLPGSGSEGGLHFLTELFAGKRNPAGTGNPRTFDGASPHFSFFVVTGYLAPDGDGSGSDFYSGSDLPVFVKRAWREALDRGHEIGIHTHTHPHGRTLPVAAWEEEMRRAIEILARPYDPAESPERSNPLSGLGLSRSDLMGFRTPYLEYNDDGLAAAARMGFVYDSSLEDGPALGPHRGDFAWPYLLDDGVPGLDPPVGPHAGLWEMPIVAFVAPPDEACQAYGIPAGFRAALKKRQSYFEPENGEITGMDWNLWIAFAMSPPEFLATLKYSLDLHLARRSPMPLGLHSELYTAKSGDAPDAEANRARRAALEAFLDYALAKPVVRVVNHRELLDWIQNPVPLK